MLQRLSKLNLHKTPSKVCGVVSNNYSTAAEVEELIKVVVDGKEVMVSFYFVFTNFLQ